MSNKKEKKRTFLWALLLIPVLLIVVIAIPIISLYVQYQSVSYVPSTPIERPDTYVIPEYPEVIIRSEFSTEIPEEQGTPEETVETVETVKTETEIIEEPSIETTEPDIIETLPPVIYEPPETDSSDIGDPSETDNNNKENNTAPKYNHNNSFANSTNAISVYGRTPIYKVDQKDSDIVNILVLGTDSQDVVLDRGRSDTMIVVSYNKKTGEIKMASLLRDMLVPIEGYDWNRINTAYFFDGVGLSINTINQLFGLDIQQFVVIDFNGAKDFIDYIGGITLTLSESEAEFVGVDYSPDPIHLSGDKALLHMRNRRSDSDFGRTERQREVIIAVIDQIFTKKSLSDILDITKYAMGMVRTNIPIGTLTSLATSILINIDSLSIETQSLPYSDAYQFAWYNKMAILSFDIQSTAKRLNEFLYE